MGMSGSGVVLISELVCAINCSNGECGRRCSSRNGGGEVLSGLLEECGGRGFPSIVTGGCVMISWAACVGP